MIKNNNHPQDEYYRIYTRRIALLLRKEGFRIWGVEPNENFPQYNVYLFMDTPQLRDAFYKIANKN